MSIENMMHNAFPQKSVEDWTRKAEESLKGKAIQTLTRTTYENIDLKPLYLRTDQEELKLSEFPGSGDFRRGSESLGYISHDWKVAQKIVSEHSNDLKEKLQTLFTKGQNAISFEIRDEFIQNLSSIVSDWYEEYPFCLDAKENIAEVIRELSMLENSEKVSGYIGRDPLAELVMNGNLNEEQGKIYDSWGKSIIEADQNMPKLHTIIVDTIPYHNGGANAVQEIALALSTAVFHIEKLKDSGIDIEKLFEKIVFKFAIGANFFVEIAKIRAARVLWSKIAEQYGISEDNRRMTISAETSLFTKTQYDPYVNLLRSGNEAFAAVLGGIDYLHVTPFNEVFEGVTAFSDRIARNTQLVLKEEAHLTKVIDPAGGSWYIEFLTNELSEKGLKLFLEIENRNGIYESLVSGWIQEQIREVRLKKEQDAFTRKQSIIGTNIYANLAEKVEAKVKGEEKVEQEQQIQPIEQVRLSQPFELLRQRSEQMSNISVGLICLGELKDHKARADFISGFLAPGGIFAKQSEPIDTLEDCVAYIKDSNLKHYFICGSNKQYDESALRMVATLHQDYPDISLYLAGFPIEAKEEWINAGIKQFVHIKSNCYEFLSSLLNDMEVEEHE